MSSCACRRWSLRPCSRAHWGCRRALQYPPAPYAHTEELIALASTAAQFGGVYATHMRSEGDAEMAALQETFRIGDEAHIPVEIFHLKVSGQRNWGKAPQVIRSIEAARARGVDVAADTYAYTAWQNTFSAFIPPWASRWRQRRAHRAPQGSCLTRARIRKDMLTPSTDWDNEWLEIKGPQDILITSVINKDLMQVSGQTRQRDRCGVARGSHRCHLRFPDQGFCRYQRRGVRHG